MTLQEITHDDLEHIQTFLAEYYREEIATLAQAFPRDQKSLQVAYTDIYRWDPDLADDVLTAPSQMRDLFEEALQLVELPSDVALDDAHIRIGGLPDAHTYYPGAFSPTDHQGQLRAITGEVSKATDVYARLEVATFECQRCGTPMDISQADGEFDDPHECHGCERQGPFQLDEGASEWVDGQKLRVQTPPEEAQADGQDIDVFVEDDLAGQVTAGDRVTVTGTIELDQQGRGSQQHNKFEPYVDAHALAVDETDADDVDISPDQRERIEALAGGAEGDPLDIAAATLAPKIHGHDTVKRALILSLVGGARTEYAGEDFDRGEFHVLLIGDPATAKSKLVNRCEQVGWRSVGVSGKGATVAGVTATAVQDDFGDGSWTLDAGAAVKAHRGVLAIDELDDMPQEVRSALYEPMSKQTIHVTKGGINTRLQTRVAVIAAANPEYDRFDPYTPIGEQFVFSSTLLSRFDLVYTFRDVPDETADAEIAGHILDARDAAKRDARGRDPDTDAHETPIEPALLRMWIALAKQQPKPVFADESVRDQILDQFTSLRGLYGYDESDDNPIPVTFRSLEGIVRVAEAAAKFEFSETIEQRHVDIATELVGRSMQDIGKDPETGELDADVKESGASKTQKERRQTLAETIQDLQATADDAQVAIDEVLEELGTYTEDQLYHDIDRFKEQGVVIEPQQGYLRYIGRV